MKRYNIYNDETIKRLEDSHVEFFVGNCLPKSFLSYVNPMILLDYNGKKFTDGTIFNVNEFYGVTLKKDEFIFHYYTATTKDFYDAIPIKVNVKKGLVYFQTENSFQGITKKIEFETRGIRCEYFNIHGRYIKD